VEVHHYAGAPRCTAAGEIATARRASYNPLQSEPVAPLVEDLQKGWSTANNCHRVPLADGKPERLPDLAAELVRLT
jgi:hypothetical protein